MCVSFKIFKRWSSLPIGVFFLINLLCRVFYLLIPCTSALGTMTEFNRNSVGQAFIIRIKDVGCRLLYELLVYASLFWWSAPRCSTTDTDLPHKQILDFNSCWYQVWEMTL